MRHNSTIWGYPKSTGIQRDPLRHHKYAPAFFFPKLFILVSKGNQIEEGKYALEVYSERGWILVL